MRRFRENPGQNSVTFNGESDEVLPMRRGGEMFSRGLLRVKTTINEAAGIPVMVGRVTNRPGKLASRQIRT